MAIYEYAEIPFVIISFSNFPAKHKQQGFRIVISGDGGSALIVFGSIVGVKW